MYGAFLLLEETGRMNTRSQTEDNVETRAAELHLPLPKTPAPNAAPSPAGGAANTHVPATDGPSGRRLVFDDSDAPQPTLRPVDY